MKRIVAMVLALTLLGCAALAQSAGTITLRDGKYIIGEDIPAGRYRLTCLGTAGEEFNDTYGALGGALDGLGGSGYASLFGALGGMMEAYVDMTVEIIGNYGTVLKSGTLKAGDAVAITLSEGTALQITDGRCTLERLAY